MTNPREILNELKWRDDRDLDLAEVFYVHRGAPEDYRILKGSDIRGLGRSFIKVEDAHIPYHRIFQIVYNGDLIFSRERK